MLVRLGKFAFRAGDDFVDPIECPGRDRRPLRQLQIAQFFEKIVFVDQMLGRRESVSKEL